MSQDDLKPGVRVVGMDDLCVYMISETHLEIFERGAPDSPLLVFGVGLISAGISFGVSLMTTNKPSDAILIFLWVATLVGIVNGSVMSLIWFAKRRSTVSLANRIRMGRTPSHGEAESLAEGAEPVIEAPPRRV
jgi:hypothetical protein